MTGASRRLLGGVLLASVALFGSAGTASAQRGQQPMVINGPDAAPGPQVKQTPAPPAAGDPAPEGAASAIDLVTLFFVITCLAGGVVAVLVAARVYDRFRVDNPIIAAVNDPWVQAKIAQELAARPGAGGEVELTAAESRPPSHH